MAKKIFNYQDALFNLKSVISQNKIPATTKPLEAELHEAAAAGKPLVINKRPLKLDGKMYPIGSEVQLDPGSKLLRFNYVTTKRRWSAGEKYYAAFKFYRDFVQPQEIKVNQLQASEIKALASVAELEAAVTQAYDQVATFRENTQIARDQLSDILEGHEA